MPQIGPSRRSLLFGATCSFGCAHAALAGEQRLDCTDLAAPPPVSLGIEEQERHEIFLLLAMTIVYDQWGVDRSNAGLRAAYAVVEPERQFADYAGHNIGAVLVDRSSTVISCALNRSVLLNNSLAHAEARTVDHAFHLANAASGPGGPPKWSFGSLLKQHVLYTTLEPCAQCAGVMELANVGSVVYGQDDPGQQQIVNVLYHLVESSRAGVGVFPVRASFLRLWQPLASAYAKFASTVTSPGQGGATRFLQTVEAYVIYREAARIFEQMEVDATNAAVLAGARQFRLASREPLQRDGLAPGGTG